MGFKERQSFCFVESLACWSKSEQGLATETIKLLQNFEPQTNQQWQARLLEITYVKKLGKINEWNKHYKRKECSW